MTGFRERVVGVFEEHSSFERSEGESFLVASTPFDAVVEVGETEDRMVGSFRVEVQLPMLDAVVIGETVAPVVEDGWYETLERRLADAHKVTRTDTATQADVSREGDTVVVAFTFQDGDPENAPEDAKAFVEFVEGTWVQGAVPGYEYDDPVAELLDRAEQEYDA